MSAGYPTSDEMKPIATAQYDTVQYSQAAAPRSYIVTGQPQNAESAPIVAPPGAPTVGMYVEERYCGIISWIVAIIGGFPCAYFCPCDRRTVWVTDNVKYNEKGAIVDDYLFLNPCPVGSMCHRN